MGNIGPGGGIDNLCPGDRPVLYQLLKSNVPHSSFVPSAVSQTTRAPYQQTIVSAIPVHSSRLPANGGIPGPIPVAGVYPPVVYPPPVVHVRDPPRNSAIIQYLLLVQYIHLMCRASCKRSTKHNLSSTSTTLSLSCLSLL